MVVPQAYISNGKTIQAYLDRRRPGSSRHGTPRREDDQVYWLAGLYQDEDLLEGPKLFSSRDPEDEAIDTYSAGFTTGEPLAAVVYSRSRRSEHYDQFKGLRGEVRPGHTDLVKHYKSRGFTDFRGGGRSSYRSTVTDVIGGSVARMYLAQYFGTRILSSICQIGPLETDISLLEQTQLLPHPVSHADILSLENQLVEHELHTLDASFARQAGELIKETRIQGDSLGAAIEVVAVNPPPLVGDPLYQSLKLRMMGTLGGLHAVQSCEMGSGKQVVSRRGSENNDSHSAAGIPDQSSRWSAGRHYYGKSIGLYRRFQTHLIYSTAPGICDQGFRRDRLPTAQGTSRSLRGS